MHIRLFLATLTITLSLVFGISFSAQAEQKVTLGKWDVHYIVFDTTFLTPEIAKANGIVRSKYNALVNISVLDSATQVAQRVDISGTARNLIGTTKELKFKRVIDGDAIYYLARKIINRITIDNTFKFQFFGCPDKVSSGAANIDSLGNLGRRV